MKKSILAIIAFILVISTVKAQDIIDPPRLFNKDTSSVIITNINEFVRGWNWDSPGRKLDLASIQTFIQFKDNYLLSLNRIKYNHCIAVVYINYYANPIIEEFCFAIDKNNNHFSLIGAYL